MLFASFALALATPASPERLVYFYGYPGHDSCANWTENRAARGQKTQALEGWILGFVAGYNAYADKTGNVAPSVPSTALLGWVDQYCATNPLDSVVAAGLKLVIELQKRQ